MRTSKIVVVSMRIASIDPEVPEASIPVQRPIEIGGGTEQAPLPAVKHEIEIGIASLPVRAKDIATSCDPHQIVEIDFVGSLVLRIRQVQLVSHLVGEEQGFSPCLLVTHRICLACQCQHGKKCKQYFLHNRMTFND